MGGGVSRGQYQDDFRDGYRMPGDNWEQQRGEEDDDFYAIRSRFSDVQEVTKALKESGLESSELIVCVDFTKSNEWTGEQTFGGRSLHFLQTGVLNPYQDAISIIARTLGPFDSDQLIPAYGFGDLSTRADNVFSFRDNDEPCHKLDEVLTFYEHVATNVNLSGPTSFAPAIYKAIEIVKSKDYAFHILLIIADGQVTNEQETVDAIVEASDYPLSIVLCGVGDGPWDKMQEFDDRLPQRRFDNFQFVNYHEIATKHGENKDAAFAVEALMEVPEQYQLIQKHGLMKEAGRVPSKTVETFGPPLSDYVQHAEPGSLDPSVDMMPWQLLGFDSAPPPGQHPELWRRDNASPKDQFLTSGGNSAQAPLGPIGESSGRDIPSAPSSQGGNTSPANSDSGGSGRDLTRRQSSTQSGYTVPADVMARCPPNFICPLTMEIMRNPVNLCDGFSYEKSAIKEWLTHSNVSPQTDEELANHGLIPNLALRRHIQEFLEHNGVRSRTGSVSSM